MKNRDKDAIPNRKIKTFLKKYFFCFVLKMKKLCHLNTTFSKIPNLGYGIYKLTSIIYLDT
jgi:hypothetical protein